MFSSLAAEYLRPREVVSQKKYIRFFALSDIHADIALNLQWVRDYCRRSSSDSDAFTVICLSGDTASDIDRLKGVFRVLTGNYDAVCFVPGNHELWRQGSTAINESGSQFAADSIEKLAMVLKCTTAFPKVYVGPLRIQTGCSSVVIFPLYSWYHSSWDSEVEIDPIRTSFEEERSFRKTWSDFSICSWPESIGTKEVLTNISKSNSDMSLALAFAQMNEPYFARHGDVLNDKNELSESPLVKEGDMVISFSHFIPRPELVVEKRFSKHPLLSRVYGSCPLEAQIRRLKSQIHIFGHSHVPIEMELEGVRYIQWCLGSVRDTQAQCSKVYAHGPLLVYNSALGNGKDGIPADRPSLNLHWTRYYTEHRRGEGGELPVLTAVSEVMAGVGVETPRSVAFHDVDPYPNHPQQPPGKSDAGEEHRVTPVDEETQYIGGI